MSRALRLSLVFAVLIGLTITPKLIGVGRIGEPDAARLARDMAAALTARGFRTAVVAHHLFDHVVARRGSCTLVATNALTQGYLRERFTEETAAIGPTYYHYRGATGPSFPRFIPVVSERLQNWANRVGIAVPRAPVIAIAASPACRLDTVDWAAFRIWPMPQPGRR
ncbi:MAG: hypothetical protein E6G92_11535 [Alphaproteobacteria bacterium]|nr:MAG: hypothetical protein E6G92_11535 [Alphaproteobacteria bacterium]